MISTIDRENAVLASFLYANDMGEDVSNSFLLSEDAFTGSFRQRIAIKINARISILIFSLYYSNVIVCLQLFIYIVRKYIYRE